MARNYTVEDVETLRQKGGISYEEAIRLLDKYDGDVASALIELEKSGHIGKDGLDMEKIGAFISKWWNKGMQSRVLIERKKKTLVDLPVSVAVLLALCAPRAMLVGVVLVLVLGGHVNLNWAEDEEQPVAEQPEAEEPAAAPEPVPGKPDDGFDRVTIE